MLLECVVTCDPKLTYSSTSVVIIMALVLYCCEMPSANVLTFLFFISYVYFSHTTALPALIFYTTTMAFSNRSLSDLAIAEVNQGQASHDYLWTERTCLVLEHFALHIRKDLWMNVLKLIYIQCFHCDF